MKNYFNNLNPKNMKRIIMLMMSVLMLTFGRISAQQLEGAWKLIRQNGNAVNDREFIKLFQDGYFAFGARESGSNKFLGAGGGPFSVSDNLYTETLDFFTIKPEEVGTTTDYSLDIVDGKMVISAELQEGSLVEIWERISESNDALTGNWVFTGRKVDNELSRTTPGDRRTIKILSGGRFQWVAFNSATKEFSGSGGGTYTAEDGRYVETITFFSRDDSRVGAELGFDFEVIDGEWHHSGKSSTGAPIYEIWTRYKDGYKPKK
jgi:hypothetical protein